MAVRAIFCGNREWSDEKAIIAALNTLDPNTDTIIHGGARGADSIAGLFATKYVFDVIAIPAQWDRYGKSAGFIRNTAMADRLEAITGPDDEARVYAFGTWGPGTKQMLKIAEHRGFKVIRVE
jgi:hypothetical protein